MEKKEEKKKLNTLDKYILFCLIFIVVYTIVHTVIFAITGQEAKTLDRLVLGTIFGEILFCFLIKRFKLHEEAKLLLGKKSEPEEGEEEE